MIAKKLIVTLNTSQSKRLIAKSVAVLPEVKNAFKVGVIGLPLCSTNSYIYEELMGIRMSAPESYTCGYIDDRGLCLTNKEVMSPEIVLIKGNEYYLDFPKENLIQYITDMNNKDIIIKSGNILDINKRAGVLVGESGGGEYGEISPYILSRGIKHIIPMTLNKTAPIKIEDIMGETGLCEISIEYSGSMPCSILPMFGKVITEIEAFKILTNTDAFPIAMSGIGGGESCVTLLLKVRDGEIDKVKFLLDSIKGEKKIQPKRSSCLTCEKTNGEFACPKGIQVMSKLNSKNSNLEFPTIQEEIE